MVMEEIGDNRKLTLFVFLVVKTKKDREGSEYVCDVLTLKKVYCLNVTTFLCFLFLSEV